MNRQEGQGRQGRQARAEPPPEADRVAHAVIGAAIEVHRTLGTGFFEATYEQALAVELELRGLPFRRQVPVKVDYKGQTVGTVRIDMLVSGRLVVEVKALRKLAPVHVAQLTSYLAALRQPLGLLLNWRSRVTWASGSGEVRLADGIRRIVRTA